MFVDTVRIAGVCSSIQRMAAGNSDSPVSFVLYDERLPGARSHRAPPIFSRTWRERGTPGGVGVLGRRLCPGVKGTRIAFGLLVDRIRRTWRGYAYRGLTALGGRSVEALPERSPRPWRLREHGVQIVAVVDAHLNCQRSPVQRRLVVVRSRVPQ